MKRSRKKRKIKRENRRLANRNYVLETRCSAAERVVSLTKEEKRRQETIAYQALKLASALIKKAGSVTITDEELRKAETGAVKCEYMDERKAVRYFV